ncbi:cysteine-rich CWC family protein [Vibrio stylophorae]|uniref:cysteine-rich CWC family protein n=1 Tax=Vibrio stylophorae TaxID=659351 RepID=UPI001F3C1E24|nr:cysteine-rich CWC family protein [Vibrio stylophorae]
MKITQAELSTSLCPLCGRGNACGNLNPKNGQCWCADPSVTFPSGLLVLVPPSLKGKACICRTCVEKYHKGLT